MESVFYTIADRVFDFYITLKYLSQYIRSAPVIGALLSDYANELSNRASALSAYIRFGGQIAREMQNNINSAISQVSKIIELSNWRVYVDGLLRNITAQILQTVIANFPILSNLSSNPYAYVKGIVENAYPFIRELTANPTEYIRTRILSIWPIAASLLASPTFYIIELIEREYQHMRTFNTDPLRFIRERVLQAFPVLSELMSDPALFVFEKFKSATDKNKQQFYDFFATTLEEIAKRLF